MSTLPRDSSDAANAQAQSTIITAARYEGEFDEVVQEFASLADNLGAVRPSAGELGELCRQVAAFTAKLFPGKIAVEVKNDPEIRDDLYFVFDVGATGSVDDIIARSNEWHLTLHRIAGSRADLFCLSFDVL